MCVSIFLATKAHWSDVYNSRLDFEFPRPNRCRFMRFPKEDLGIDFTYSRSFSSLPQACEDVQTSGALELE